MGDAIQDRGLLVALQLAVDHREFLVDQAWEEFFECPERDEHMAREKIRSEYMKLQWSIARRDRATAEMRGERHLKAVTRD